ncbi:MAG: hypothetical protein QOG44_792 [Acidimicrobiaceae bacterium]|nr:hypothetical protein [Acidimicrobiaceae bacterium]
MAGWLLPVSGCQCARVRVSWDAEAVGLTGEELVPVVQR